MALPSNPMFPAMDGTSLGMPGMPGTPFSPPGIGGKPFTPPLAPTQQVQPVDPSEGMQQLQGLTQMINQRHQELLGHLQQHAALRQQLGV